MDGSSTAANRPPLSVEVSNGGAPGSGRARVQAGQGIDHLVPPGVASYIARHHLYTKT